MRRQRRILWVTDPWESLDHPTDTTLRLVEESCSLGLANYWCDLRAIWWNGAGTVVEGYTIDATAPGRHSSSFRLSRCDQPLSPRWFDSIQYRPDPPVDRAYLHPLQLLVLGLESSDEHSRRQYGHTEIVNPPALLLGSTEKLEVTALRDLMPPTVVATRWDHLAEFGNSECLTVLKPLHEAGGRGIRVLDWRTPAGRDDAKEALTMATSRFTSPVLLQRYLADAGSRECRLWFIDGELLASATTRATEHGRQVISPSAPECPLEEGAGYDSHLPQLVGARLRARGIRLAAVDLIQGQVTDCNFTSPGLLVEMEAALSVNLAKRIVEALAGSG